VFAVAWAGRLWSVKNRVSFTFGLIMAAQALNCAILGALAVNQLLTGEIKPPWSDLVLMVNAITLGLGPVLLSVFLFNGNYKDSGQSSGH
jgi:hypothetical protein